MDAPLEAAPLPDNPYSPVSEKGWHSAFESCKRLEGRGTDDWDFVAGLDALHSPPVMLGTSPTVAARTLGYTLIYAPNEQGRDNVAHEVNSCGDDAELLAGLAHLLIFGLIRIFRNPKGPTPMVSAELSPRLSFGDDAAQGHTETIDPPESTPPWLRNQVAARDRYRCAFTGALDEAAVAKHLAQGPLNTVLQDLQVAHIISQSLTSNIGGMSSNAANKFAWASSAAVILERFAGAEIRDLLHKSGLNHPSNAFMASYTVHRRFDRLDLWLLPLKNAQGDTIPNAYSTGVAMPHFRAFGILPEVQFQESTYNGQVVPPPHAALIAIHAACAQIAHLSGAIRVLEMFDEQDDDYELRGMSRNPNDMSFDTVGFAALERALHRLQVGAL